MDTLLLPSDTLLSKIVVLTKSIEPVMPESAWSRNLPLITLLLGAILGFVSQFLFRWIEERKQRKRDAVLTKNGLIRSINMMHFLLRELAYLKVDTNLQNYYAEHDTTEEGRKRALEESYNNYREIATRDEKLIGTYSDLYSDMIRFHELMHTDMPEETVNALNELRDNIMTLERAAVPQQGNDINAWELNEGLRLTTVYAQVIEQMESIVDAL
jgi:hypothetical protein